MELNESLHLGESKIYKRSTQLQKESSIKAIAQLEKVYFYAISCVVFCLFVSIYFNE